MKNAFAVFGLGKAGQAALQELSARGAAIYAWDDGEPAREKTAAAFPQVKLSAPSAMPWAEIETLFLSPGVPLTFPAPHEVVKLAQQHNVPIICEVELLVQKAPNAHYTGITGTNGKSTTTALIGHIYRAAGLTTEVGGNIGVAACSLPAHNEQGNYVLELSSYQLELLSTLHCNTAVLLNVTPDHLDRHGDMAGYIAAKYHIFDRQQAGDVAVIAVDDAYTQALSAKLKSAQPARKVIEVSAHNKLPQGITVIDGVIHDNVFDKAQYALGPLPRLNGQHNAQNIAVSYAAARARGITAEVIVKAVQSFQGLPHRMQYIAEYKHLLFVNDSKATNAVAAEQALRSYTNIYWIAGGVPKAGGITTLSDYFPRMKQAFLIGQAAEEFATTLEHKVPYTHSKTLAQALQDATQLALKDTQPAVILLSPACASFDQFTSYEQRGDQCMQWVRDFIKQKQAA